MGAVQAQDYLCSLWAVGLRMRQATARIVEQALAERTIVRTWPMRGTLHFVAPEDARWMLKLMATRIIAGHTRRLLNQFGVDDAVLASSRKAFETALQGGRQLTRDGMYQALEAAGISATNGRGLHILWRVAQEGLICFAAREGKQPAFALLDEWAPRQRTLGRDEALAELVLRYFTSHGPATLQDFVWWTGLTVADAKAGLEMVRTGLASETIGGHECWLAQTTLAVKHAPGITHLLPPFDEYLVAYRDRSAALDARYVHNGMVIMTPTIISKGRVIGTWRRAVQKKAVRVTTGPGTDLTKTEKRAFAAAATRYASFLDLPVALASV
jgi:hypothetical protein